MNCTVLKLVLCAVAAGGALSSCRTKVVKVEVPYFPPERGKELAYSDSLRVRSSDVVQTYYAGRMPSKDRRTMREAGRVYRVVQAAGWDTRPLSQPFRGTGPVVGLRDPHYRPLGHEPRVKAEVARQRVIAQNLGDQAAQLSTAVQALRQRTADSLKERELLQQAGAALREERSKRQTAERELVELKSSQGTQTKSASSGSDAATPDKAKAGEAGTPEPPSSLVPPQPSSP